VYYFTNKYDILFDLRFINRKSYYLIITLCCNARRYNAGRKHAILIALGIYRPFRACVLGATTPGLARGWWISPFQGLGFGWATNPGRYPGVVNFALSGLVQWWYPPRALPGADRFRPFRAWVLGATHPGPCPGLIDSALSGNVIKLRIKQQPCSWYRFCVLKSSAYFFFF
jgi:hypothetical protein